MAKKNYKYNIFDSLKKINEGDTEYINSLTEEHLKELSPYVVQRWAYGAQEAEEMHTILTNVYVNPYVFSLQEHPKLLLKLHCVANGGYGDTRYKFVNPVKKQKTKDLTLIMQHYCYNMEQAEDVLGILSSEDIKTIREQYDYED